MDLYIANDKHTAPIHLQRNLHRFEECYLGSWDFTTMNHSAPVVNKQLQSLEYVRGIHHGKL